MSAEWNYALPAGLVLIDWNMTGGLGRGLEPSEVFHR